jgi:rhomboid protease GluP
MLDQYEAKTCPKCEALITPQLDYCRQCQTYLHGTAIEGWIFKNLLGGYMSGSPGTAVICILILLYYVLMSVLAGLDSFLGFTSFSLTQLGATHGPSILRGQYWRFMTSIFGHHDILHLAMNLWCLVTVGPLVEKIFDRKKMLILYLVAGSLSMVTSHIWYVLILGGPNTAVVSAGASGAVCGMIGAAWFGARRLGPAGKEVAGSMKRWAILMLVWGVFVPGINNAAHLGGFAFGAALSQFIPTGLTQSVKAQKILSVNVLGLLLGFFFCCGLMLTNLQGYPASFDDDMQPRSIFGQVYSDGAKPDYSAQARILRKCQELLREPNFVEAEKVCELNARLNGNIPQSYLFLAILRESQGQTEAADHLRAITARMIGQR